VPASSCHGSKQILRKLLSPGTKVVMSTDYYFIDQLQPQLLTTHTCTDIVTCPPHLYTAPRSRLNPIYSPWSSASAVPPAPPPPRHLQTPLPHFPPRLRIGNNAPRAGLPETRISLVWIRTGWCRLERRGRGGRSVRGRRRGMRGLVGGAG
jgi:hypothetical protein